MDSKLSASQLPQHHHLSSSSGSSFSSSTPASHYSDINDSAKTHVLKLDNGDNFSGGLGGSDGGGSETEGFVSGEEDFDASSERAFVRDTDEETVVEAIAGEDTHVKFVNSSEFFLPSSQRPIAKVSVDDDDDDDDDEDDVGDSKFGDLRSGDVVRESFGDGRDLKIVGGENSVVENLGTKGGVLESEEEVLVETGPGKNANFGELVKENGVSDAQEPVVEALVGGEVDKGLESSKFVEDVGSVVEGSSVPEKQLEVTEIENKKAVEPEQTDVLNGTSEVVTESKENGGVFEDRTILDGVDEQENRLVVEQADDKLVEEHGVDFTSGGDSVVQAVRVNLSQTGAAVVGDVEAIEESEIKGMEVPVGVSLDNEFEKISCDIEEPNESKLVALDSEPDRVVVAESGNVEVHGKKTVVAGADEVDSEKRPEREQGKLVEEHGVDFTSGGDSVVQAVRVNLSQTGAAVVGDVEAIEESEIKGMEVPVGVSLDNEFEKISCDIEEPNESKLVALDSEPDRVVVAESGNVEVHGKKTVVAGADEVDSEKRPEREQGKLVEEHGVDFTSGGDSVVQAVRVNLSQTGAAVVGDVEAIEESEIKGMEVPVGVSLDNEFEKISCDIEEPNESKLVALDSEPDRVVVAESGNVEVHGKKTVVAGADEVDFEKRPEREDELKSDSETRQNGLTREIGANEVEVVSDDILVEGNRAETLSGNCVSDLPQDEPAYEAKPGNADFSIHDQVDESETVVSGESHEPEFVEPSSTNQEIRLEEEVEEKHCTDEGGIESVEPSSILNRDIRAEAEDDDKDLEDDDGENEGSVTDGNSDGMVFGSSEAAKQFLEELERGSGTGSYSGAEGYHDHSQRIDGQIVTDSDEEVDTDEEGGGQELFDSAALAALLKAATGAASDGGNVTFTSPDGSKLFSVERPAGLGSSIRSVKPASRPNHSNLFTSSNVTVGGDSESSLTEEEKTKLEKFQQIRVKFLRLVQRLGVSTEDSIARQVLYRLALVSGRQNSHEFSLEAAKMTALQLEAEGKDDLDFSLNILVLGKAGVGKSATINSIFGEEKTPIYAFGPATTTVKEIVGVVDGIKIRVFDTPGLKSAAMEQGVNRKILSSVQKFTKKCPPDIVLYVDRLDTQSRDLNDVPILRSITSVFGTSIWRSTIVTLTHAASAPPDGPSGSPLNYELFVAQRSQILQQTIGQSVGDLRFMNPSLMSPISLVENHPSCRKNRDGQKVLPNGQSWRPQLLLLCFSMKVLSEATNLSKPQESFDHKKLFGFRSRSPPLPYLLSWLLQSRTHPKLSADQGGENADSDIDLDDLADSDQEEEEDEYDQLPSFKPLKKSQIAKLSKEQRKAYVEEYDYRVKLLQKKMWREELKRMKEMKKGKVSVDDYGYVGEEDPENGGPAAVPVPLPDMVLPPSFDGENPAYRYRFLEPTSQFLARPVLDAQGWDHDCGYDGVNLEQSLAIANSFPAAVAVQITKDKKEFNIHLDSSVAAKHGENGSSMAGFDIQNIGKQLAYIVRGETKFKNFKKNKTTAGVSVTFLGENVSTGVKVEDQIALGKRLVLVGSTGTVRSQGDSAYGANLEVRLREADYPIGQDQSSLGLSLVKWRGDLALGANFQSQFSLGRNYKMAVRAGLNNKLSGQISIRTSSSEQLQLALVAVLPIVRSICNIIWPGVSENYSIY